MGTPFVVEKFRNLKNKISFGLYCAKRGNAGRFVRNVEMIGKESNLLNLMQYGTEGAGTVYYHIAMEESRSGFFADHNRLLGFLYFADHYHLRPVVEFHQNYCYAETNPVNGSTNPFEYFFEQPAGISLDDMHRQAVVLKSRKENGGEIGRLNQTGAGYERSEEYMNELGKITEKYIRLNKQVAPIIQAGIAEMIQGKKCLGVHVRGTDFKQNYNGHPVKVTTKEYLEETKRIFDAKGYEQVFLATDDEEATHLFYETFGNQLRFYQNVTRSNGSETVMKSESKRENHHYLLGVEVLRDMYTLAECDGLISGLSQVSFAARIQKKSSHKEYEDLILIDKGLNQRKRDCK